ncbi:MAG: UDP-N-acetylmuramoyl-L-alanyl-D-glutamate--2,6-diaminopimelate ligase [Candidatus Omnitrophota bacterium]|nr:UDP-N-acetylmuramoyl-L-alanyl-D-glutamate--2,6-diaminopimelate ligase [Candidatus Omnitrophota bacterium]
MPEGRTLFPVPDLSWPGEGTGAYERIEVEVMEDKVRALFKKISFDRNNVKTDSRKIKPGDVFVAIRGTARDGHDYVREAFEKGALISLCEHEVPVLPGECRGKVVIVEDTRIVLGDIAREVFDDPSSALSVYGVTGTNGKTTTVFLIDAILSGAGRPSGLVSTVFTRTRGETLDRSSMTTPGLMKLNRFLSEMISDGKRAAVVEISSHALDQKRICGIGLDSAVFTNISPEHLDYHKDMKTYLKDKSLIFNNLKKNGTGVLNLDDPMVRGLMDTVDFPDLVTFGLGKDADVRAENIRLSEGGTELDILAGKLGSANVSTRLIGRHNVYNMLAAAAALLNSGLDIENIKEALETFSPVPGRLDAVVSRAPFSVFVDYAHTPNALENVLQCMRPLTSGKLICVFGCGGDRDWTKRPVMGRIACELCDRVILTSDNPRTEEPEEILRQIEKGVLNKNNYSIMKKRSDAIQGSLKTAEKGDIVIIAGKGHEDYQIMGDKVLHFDDKEVAGEMLRGMGY